MVIIVFIGLFFSSLVSHGAVINTIGALIIIFYSFAKGYFFKLHKKHIISIACISIFIILQAVLFLMEMGFKPAQVSRDALFNNIIMCFILLFFSISISMLIYNESERFVKALSWIVILNVLFFILQFFTVYLSGNYIDAVYLFTGEESRYQNYFLQGAAASIVEYRVTGLYVEPSTYVAVLCVLSTAHRLLTNKTNLYSMVIITSLMTFSTISFVVAFFMGMSLLKRTFIWRFILALIVFLIPIVTIFNGFFVSAIDDFLLKVSLTSGERLDLIGMIYYLDEKLNLVGYGLFSIPEKIHMLASTGIGQYRVASINDAGLINFIGMKFGVLGVVFVLALMFVNLTYQRFIMAFSIMITKISFMFPVFIIVLVPFLLSKSRDKAIL
ncbi:hypothetical protein [Aeromonas hydrophila]|uniref:hypothetical protein n=1 Tax=Aeromonas hydrophila TaxID=644 RepID=UPI000AF7414C|nr:hypothetical protein [Aeromonas hydrophila]